MSKPQFGDYGEPWIDDDGTVYFRQQNGLPSGNIFDFSEWGGPDDEGRRIAARMVACVNACAGLTDEELQRVRAVNEMYRACKDAAWLYDQMALGPLEAAAKYGPDYEPPSDDDYLEIRGNLEKAIAKATGGNYE